MIQRMFVAMGTSLGGLNALETVLAALPGDFGAPIAVVQHRCDSSQPSLVRMLRLRTALSVCEPEDKEPIAPGHVYIAAPGYHTMVEDAVFVLSTDPPVNHARPSIDVLFDSVADTFGAHSVCVVMSGASADGARGAARIRAVGGMVLVQSPETAESPVMPRAALAFADEVAGLDEIGPRLVALCGRTGQKP